MEIVGLGYSGENFSVEREIEFLMANDKIKSDYSVFITNNPNRKSSEKKLIVHRSFCQDTDKILGLRNNLLKLGLKNGGLNKASTKPLCFPYIIHNKALH